MGQYHCPVSLDAREHLVSHNFGDGLKLMEFGQSGYGMMAGLVCLLLPESRWYGHRIAIVGDYEEPGDVPAEILSAVGLSDQDGCLYELGEEVSGAAKTALLATGMVAEVEVSWNPGKPSIDPVKGFEVPPALRSPLDIVNFDTGQALVPEVFGDEAGLAGLIETCGGGVMTALACLLAVSNDRGGGDIHTDSPLIGAWGGHRIGVIPRRDALDERLSADLLDMLIKAHERDDRWRASFRAAVKDVG